MEICRQMDLQVDPRGVGLGGGCLVMGLWLYLG